MRVQVGRVGLEAGRIVTSRLFFQQALERALCARQVALTAREMKLTRRNATSKIHTSSRVGLRETKQVGVFLWARGSNSSSLLSGNRPLQAFALSAWFGPHRDEELFS